MNPWQWAAAAVALTLLPCADMSVRGSAERRLVGMEMTSVMVIIEMVLLTVGRHRLLFMDLPLALSVMSFGGGLVYARFLEKHL